MAAAGRERPPIDWDSLTFSFTETDRMFVANGSWEDGQRVVWLISSLLTCLRQHAC